MLINMCTNTPTTSFMSACTSYVHSHIYIADMKLKEESKCTITSEGSIFVKITNNIVMLTFCGFHWYPYFGVECSLWHFEEANGALAS